MSMFVGKRMSPNPVTVLPSATIFDAMQIMSSCKIRRLPVVDDGKLVGIVTDRDLKEVSPSSATSLSIYELNYLLAKMQVKDIMKKKVVTILQSAVIEEAALLMYNHKIGGLVVVDEKRNVVGVITETDIFKSFIDVMGLQSGKTRLTIDFTDKVGVLHEVTAIFAELGINIDSMVCYNEGEGVCELVIRVGVQDTAKLAAELDAKGYHVHHVAQIG